jgi:hypothetical protein
MKNFIDEDGVYHNLENLSLRQIYNDGWFSGYKTGLGIGIEELEKLKPKIESIRDVEVSDGTVYVSSDNVNEILDEGIAELKGE